jgi:hypothetical protein
MKRYLLVIPAWLLMAAALLFVVSRKRAETKPHDGGRGFSTDPQSRVHDAQGGKSGKPKSAAGAGKPVGSSPARNEEVLREIESAVITYSPEGVMPIASHLLDSDPVLRESARQGLVQLGEPAAVPHLREAARRLDGSEAEACQQAAAFLELPSWSETEEARAISEQLSKPTNEP